MGQLVNRERIDPDRIGDVLELGRAEIGHSEIEPAFHLTIGVLRQTHPARSRDPLQSRGDVDAVAHQIAVGLLDHVAEMDADAKFDAAIFWHSRVALDQAGLNLDRAAHGVDHAAELDEAPVAGALDDAPVMGVDRGIDQIAAQAAQTRKRPVLVGAG